MAESSKDLLKQYGLRAQTEANQTKGVVTGQTQHYLFNHGEGYPFRHGVIGKYSYPGVEDYYGVYLSLHGNDELYLEHMHILGISPSTVCCAGLMQKMPTKLRTATQSLLVQPIRYVGFDWLMASRQPSMIDLEVGLQNLHNLLDDFGTGERLKNDSVVS